MARLLPFVGPRGNLGRAACRCLVAERSTVDRMADRYLELYRQLLGG